MTRLTNKATRFLAAALLLVTCAVTPAIAGTIVVHSTGENGGSGKPDPNYLMTGPANYNPIQPYEVTLPGTWVTPPPGLWWDNPVFPLAGAPVGLYVYQTTFDLTGFGPATAVLQGQSAADDTGDIYLNGTKVATMGGIAGMAPFTITEGVNGAHFVSGKNYLHFVAYNGAWVTGILVDISGTAFPTAKTGGTWAPVSTAFPGTGAGSMLLLTDGRVLFHDEQKGPSNWYILTPNAYGDYTKGSWAAVASPDSTAFPFCYAPLAYASAVLPDGRAIIEGGEYNFPIGKDASGNKCPKSSWPPFPDNTTKGAIYDPVKNTWTAVAPPIGWATIGDAQSAVLPDGTFMLADSQTFNQAEMSAPYTGGASWAATGTFKADRNDEEGWTLLPGPVDAEILLTVDTSLPSSSEIYQNGYWFGPFQMPSQLWDPSSHEIGPAVLRPDGTVVQFGGTTAISGSGETAIFHNASRQWSAGPNIPAVAGKALDIADGPAALLPNGNVLAMTSPGDGTAGATFFELQFGTDQLVQAAAPPNATKDQSFFGHMLVLPTGQIMFTDFGTDVEIYTPTDHSIDPSWRPRVTAINGNTCVNGLFCLPTVHNQSVNTVDGLQLNGMSQGAAYGDDYQSATNYPLVRLAKAVICSTGCKPPVYYCRTHDHGSMGVATGALPVSTKFDCKGVPGGYYTMEVVANGISWTSPFGEVQVVP